MKLNVRDSPRDVSLYTPSKFMFEGYFRNKIDGPPSPFGSGRPVDFLTPDQGRVLEGLYWIMRPTQSHHAVTLWLSMKNILLRVIAGLGLALVPAVGLANSFTAYVDRIDYSLDGLHNRAAKLQVFRRST